MHRFAAVAVMVVTAYFLIATSAPPCRSPAETVMLTSRTSCGPDTPVTISRDSNCSVTLDDPASGLPNRGYAFSASDAGLVTGSGTLQGFTDAGLSQLCDLTPNDAGTGWDVSCQTCPLDAGTCDSCSGTVAP